MSRMNAASGASAARIGFRVIRSPSTLPTMASRPSVSSTTILMSSPLSVQCPSSLGARVWLVMRTTPLGRNSMLSPSPSLAASRNSVAGSMPLAFICAATLGGILASMWSIRRSSCWLHCDWSMTHVPDRSVAQMDGEPRHTNRALNAARANRIVISVLGVAPGPGGACRWFILRHRRSDVDRLAERGQRRLLHRLFQRRVRVAGARDVLGTGAELHSDGDLGDQDAGFGADNVGAQHPVGRRVRQDLDEAVGVPDRAGAAVGQERELADLVGDLLLLELLLGPADRSHLRVRVHHARNDVVVDVG